MSKAWAFIQNELLGMQWLHRLTGDLLCALGLDVTERIGGSIHFFIYDTVKIFVLLGFLIFIISYIQSYFPPERTKKILGRLHGMGANVPRALLGTVTPFCSCSSIPLFIGFTGAGCPSCHKQYENAKAAVSELSLGIEVEYVTDMGKVMTYGVMSMPAIVVNDKVIAMGRILSVEEVKMALDKFI